jgi:hypothetical protein
MFSIPPGYEEEHAIDCASQQQGLPIALHPSVATTRRRSRMLKAKARQNHQQRQCHWGHGCRSTPWQSGPAASRPADRGPLAPSDWKNRSAAVLRHFVDLLCCRRVGVLRMVLRGYGQLARLLSYNQICSINPFFNCTWTTAGDIWLNFASRLSSYLMLCSYVYKGTTQTVDAW